MSESEEWRAIVGYEGVYAVSSLGRVRSLERKSSNGKGTRTVRERILRPKTRRRGGYLEVNLAQPGYNRVRKVHQLVAEAFSGGARPEGWETRHINGDRTDSRALNVCWGTREQNIADKFLHGTVLRGESAPWSKLTHRAVAQMRTLGATLTHTALAARFGVSRQTVDSVIAGRAWV